MKIACVTSTFFPSLGGSEIALHNLLIRLIEKYGVQVTLYVPASSFRFLRKQKIHKNFPYKIKSLKPFLFRWKGVLGIGPSRTFLLKEQEKNKFNVWYSNGTYPAGYLIAFIKSVPKVLICQGDDIQIESSLKYGLRRKKWLDRKIIYSIKKMDKLIAISKTIEDEYLNISPELKESIRRIPNSVSVSRFHLDNEKESLRKKMGISIGKQIILTIGRFHPKKGYQIIPEIIKSLLEHRNDFCWILVGRGCSELVLKKPFKEVQGHLIVKEGVFDLKHKEEDFLSRVKNLPSRQLIEYYHASDVFVFPSLFESFGIVLIEAMASGLPVVTTNAPGCRDIVQEGITGLKVPTHNAQKMADAINRILNSHDLREKITQNALNSVQEKYDLDITTDQYYSLYQELIQQPTS